jgi:hypothetical protein
MTQLFYGELEKQVHLRSMDALLCQKPYCVTDFYSRIFEDGSLELILDGQVEKAPLGQYCVGFKKVFDENGGASKEPIFAFCIQDVVNTFISRSKVIICKIS